MEPFFDDLTKGPELEVQLLTECKVREVENCNDIEELRKECALLVQQNAHQDVFINNCLSKLTELQAILICKENKVIQKRGPWWKRIF
tara:strand:- start:205 stop:468 length:264 start_codon:yes stop_codon:yes gene_type:complete